MKIIELIKKHDQYRKNCINLMPSENFLSYDSRYALQSDLGRRYFFQTNYKISENATYSYRGSKYISEILISCQKLSMEVFKAEYVSVYPISGHLANIGILLSLTKPGDTIVCHSPAFGGYPGLDKNTLPKYLNLNVEYFPMDKEIIENIDLLETEQILEKIKPKVVIFSSANTLFSPPIKELKRICKKNGVILVYDGSHPLGLIAGGKFAHPLDDGADILVGGTQKSFPGPQGAIIATNSMIKDIKNVEQFVMVDNPHFNRIAALAVSLEEIKVDGEDYAEQVIKNTKALAKELDNNGVRVKYPKLGYSDSHMLKLVINKNFEAYCKKLEDFNIIIDGAGRIGTNEITRIGMKENEMREIGKVIGKIINSKCDNSEIKLKVISLVSKFY